MSSSKVILQSFPWSDPEGWLAAVRGSWPAKWIRVKGHEKRPLLACYRLGLHFPQETLVRILCTGDERYELFLNGQRLGRGPERGDPDNWYVDAYDIAFPAGQNVLVARVWSAGLFTAPWSHVSLSHGFLLASAEQVWQQQLSTGIAPWESLVVDGFDHGTNLPGLRGAWHKDEVFDGRRFPWKALEGGGDGWEKPEIAAKGRSKFSVSWKHNWEHQLRLGELPAQRISMTRPGRVVAVDQTPIEQATLIPFQMANTDHTQRELAAGLIRNQPYVIPAHSCRRVLIDLETYRCAFQHLIVHGGAQAQIELAMDESLVHVDGKTVSKGTRQNLDGLTLRAGGALWTLDGGNDRHLEYLWWRSGRYVRLSIVTKAEALTIASWCLEETGYPLDDLGTFSSDAAQLDALIPISVRTLAACQHESFMDCPFYEQQLWVGDMLPQVLSTLVMTRDDRLIRRSLRFLADSRWTSEGLVNGRYPAPQKLAVPSFALWWVHMVVDYAWWRGDQHFVRGLMMAARDSVEHLLSYRDQDGLLRGVPGWDYSDWVSGWNMGVPPGAPAPTFLSLLLSVTLDRLADLETWLSEPELSTRWRRLAGGVWTACCQNRFDSQRRRFCDDAQRTSASEHLQALAALSPRMDESLHKNLKESLETDSDLNRCSVFFDHHLIESYSRLGLDQEIQRRYETYDFVAQGLTTTPEGRRDTRSDCHAWSAHFRYHSVATILGIRPAAWGFAQVVISPHLGNLRQARGTVPHPKGGEIRVDLHRNDTHLLGTVELPPGLTGHFQCQGKQVALHPGKQTVAIPITA